MKLMYKSALQVFIVGLTLLVSITYIFFKINSISALEIEKKSSFLMALKISNNLEIFLENKINTILTLSHAPVIREKLKASNSYFEAFSPGERQKKIEGLNKKWMAAKSKDDPILRPYLINPVAGYFHRLGTINPNEYGEIFVTDRHGVLVASTGRLTTLAHAHKYWWKETYADGQGRPYIDDRGYDTSVKGYVVGVVVPVREGGKIIGILKANLNVLEALGRVINHPNKEIQVQLVRSNGLVVYQEGLEPLSKEVTPIIGKLLQEKFPGTVIELEQGIESLVSFAPVGMTFGTESLGFGGKPQSQDHSKGNEEEGWHILVSERMDNIKEATAKSARNIGLVGGAIVFVMAVISLLVGWTISNPIKMLTQKTREMENGNFEVLIDYKGHDEIGILVNSFNRMSKTLNDTMISRDVLIEEVEARHRAEEKLADHVEELARSNADLEIFAYAASHDLQEPLRKVSNFAGLLMRKQGGKLDEKSNLYLKFIEDGSIRMQKMIKEILLFSRVGRKEDEVSVVDMNKSLQHVKENLALKIAGSSTSITNDNLPRVQISPIRIEQVLQNLIDNAIKFRSKENPEIHISASNSNGEWEIKVCDNGIGINPKYDKRVFQIFQQLNKHENYSGTGMGLAMAKKIIEFQKGKIWVIPNKGKGSTFHFTLSDHDKKENQS